MISLRAPERLRLAEKTAGMVVIHIKRQLMERRRLVLVDGTGRRERYVDETAIQRGVAQLIPGAKRPFVAQKLVQAYHQRFFREIQRLASVAGAVGDGQKEEVGNHAHSALRLRVEDFSIDA